VEIDVASVGGLDPRDLAVRQPGAAGGALKRGPYAAVLGRLTIAGRG